MKKTYQLVAFILLFLLVFIVNQAFDHEDYSIHSTQNDSWLNISDEPKCKDCHSDLIEKKEVHAPAVESCDDCHQVNIKEHAENGVLGLNLTEKLPELCFNCHDDVKSNLDTIRNVHKAVISMKGCVSCHSPHSSGEKKLLVLDEKKLCLGCHSNDISSDGKRLVNIEKLVSTAKVIHPPLESDGCAVCHLPHGSSNNYLLKGAFPSGNYAPAKKENFAFCWECHDSDLFDLAVTSTATNFRDSTKNLNYIHLKGKNSRSCVVCHNIHASQNLHLIEDKVPYGQWILPIRYKPNENGGSCFPGCHSEKSYSR